MLDTKTKKEKWMKKKEQKNLFPDADVLVVGFANTGIAAARFLAKHGCRVTISERKPVTELQVDLHELEEMGVHWEFGGHKEKTFLDKDWILVSPGVPMDVSPLVKARARGIPILSDIELAFRISKVPILAVTGTNGKTTTTTLLGEILKAGGKRTFVGGNIGTPILEAFDHDADYDFIVAEVSSFQLEGVVDFAPHIAIILNLTPDHLNRYPGMKEYKEAKERIVKQQTSEDYAILNARDPWVYGLAEKCFGTAYLFDSERHVTKGAEISEGHVIIHDQYKEVDLGAVEGMGLYGSHNLENIMAASLAAYLVGVSDQDIRAVLRDFKGLPHRLERVGEINGVRFVNDSKGTNVGAVIKALESIDAPIILIAGGQDKGGDFSALSQLVRNKVEAICLIGEARAKIAHALAEYTRIIESEDLRSAIHESYRMAKPGDTVLLSPGCASFDMFKDYKDRGEQFKKMLMELIYAEKKKF
ncbi:MAG: UDP-N-acetylmuramoyl-L-alanine--D-glutamate ligase [bacterium]